MIETIDHNVYMNGIGGASTNGFEFILSNGTAHSFVALSNSFFQNNPGDMLEEFNYGAGSTATLVLDHVTVEDTTISDGTPSYANPPDSAAITGNLGECLAVSADGADDTTVLQMTDSSLTGCDNDGIQVTANHVEGNGTGNLHSVVVNIDNSRINGSRFYNLWVNDLTPLAKLRVRVQDSDLSVSSSGVAVAFDQQPTGAATSALIDLGGGTLGSNGHNCLPGGAIYDLEATAYRVFAQNDWWGTPNGPAVGKVRSTGGAAIYDGSPLRRAPPACE